MSKDHDLIEGADWASASGRSLLRRLEAAADTWPWVPDIDDPHKENPRTPGGGYWTGKFYVGEEGHTWCTYNYEPHTIHNVRLTQAMRSAIGPLSRRVEELEAEAVRPKEYGDGYLRGVAEERERWTAAIHEETERRWRNVSSSAVEALTNVLRRLGIAQ